MRDVKNRYKGLPPRTPEMLFQICRKFYRGAVSHYDLIQEKKADVVRAYDVYRATGEKEPLSEALTTLFWEFHFYVTCWLQIDLALYRLMRMERFAPVQTIMESFRSVLDVHLAVRDQLEKTEACVEAQWRHFGPEMACVLQDAYWFDGVLFSVDGKSLEALHQLYREIQRHQA